MGRLSDVVVVGASLAGTHAAMTLRKEGFDGAITLIGEESDPPYDRPPVSKQYLVGELEFERMLLWPREAYEEHSISLELGARALRVDPRDRAVELEDGRRLRADAIVIATGSRNRSIPVAGADLPWVHSLRSRADADRLREQLAGARRAVVVGMGFIGCEVAAALRKLDVEACAVEALPLPLGRVLGPEVGGAVAALHAENGVELLLGEGVDAFEQSGGVRRVRLSGGRVLECDLTIVGVGARPNVELVAGTDVAVDGGIVVDELCRTTVEGIYAAGDVTAHYHPLFGERLRVEHWRNAIEQGAAAARSVLGVGTPYADLHWFWSDQYETNLQYYGHHAEVDEVVVRGELEERRFIAFYLKRGVPQAAAAMNMGRDLRRARELLIARAPVDATALRDPDVDLRRLTVDA